MKFVAAATQVAPVLVTVSNVPIVEAGVEYMLSTGPATFTPEDLRDAVTAENEDASIPSPRLKIGHVDARYNDRAKFDGTPAFGKATNLRLSENGMVVYADFVGVPKWLADIMPTAYPSRSIEGYWQVESHAGKTWEFVISAVSLLGIEWPGVNQLEDLPQYYGAEMPEGISFVQDVAAGQGGDPTKLFGKKAQASANLDDVRRAFYAEYVEDNPGAYWWWIRAVLISPNELIVEDDENGQLYKLPFEVTDDGGVSFGETSAVRIEYVEQTAEARKAAATYVAAGLVSDREVVASWSTRAESRPATATGGSMDPALVDLRNRLGLPEDTPEAKLQEIATTVATAVNGNSSSVGPDESVVTVGTGDGPQSVVPPVAQAASAASETEEPKPDDGEGGTGGEEGTGTGTEEDTVVLDRATFDTLQTGAAAALRLEEAQQTNERQALVAAAITDGRIPPARKDHWLGLLAADPQGGKEALASLTPGLIPVSELGVNGDGETTNQGPAYPIELFPELARQQAEDAAHAAAGRRSRVSGDKMGAR